jgi:hypothetical protein
VTSPSLKKASLFPAWDGREWFQFLFLGALYGIFFLRFGLAFYLNDLGLSLDSMNDLLIVYLLGWTLCPAAGLFSAWLMERARRNWEIPASFYYPLLLLLNVVWVLLVLHPALSGPWTGIEMIVGFLACQASGALLSKLMEKKEWFWMVTRGGERHYFLMVSLLAVWVLALPCSWRDILGSQTPASWVFFAFVLWFFLFGLSSRRAQAPPVDARPTSAFIRAGREVLAYGFVLFLIAYLVMDPNFRYSPDNVSCYLGPLADMSAGKSLLVNINAQYGVLVFYFLRLIFHFLPMGFMSFTLVGFALMVLQYLVFYYIARQIFHSKWLSLFCLVALLLINYFYAQFYFREFYPSGGALRFGFIYLLAALVVLRNRHPLWKNRLYPVECLVAAAAFLWSFEVCLYTVPAYAGLAFYESLESRDGKFLFRRAEFGRRLGMFLGFTAVLGLLTCLHIYLTSHEWPHLSYYWDYLSAYHSGLSRLPMPGFGFWWILAGVLYFSTFGLLGLFLGPKKTNPPRDLNLAALLTFCGITQFLYFLYRAHPANLLAITMPGFLLLVYWLYHLRQGESSAVPAGIQRGVYTLVIVLGALGLARILPMAVDVIQQRLVSLPSLAQKIHLAAQDLPRQDAFALKANQLMEKYSGGQKALIYFFGLKDLEVSLYTGRTEAYPYNDIIQAGGLNITAVQNRILNYDPQAKPGDCVYLSADMDQVKYGFDFMGMSRKVNVTLEQSLFSKLSGQFNLRRVEKKDGITVYRLQGRKTGS